MKSQTCREQRLAEYVDGELSGIDRLDVSRHLDQCADCVQEANTLRRVGDLLRSAAALEPAPAGLAGLAGGVISRTSAERAQSWRAVFGRAVEDWHWFLVGFGSVAAAFVSITFVSAMLHFGPAPEREDSVSGLLSNPDWQVKNSEGGGSLYVWATPARGNEWRIVLTARERAEAAADAVSSMPAALEGLTTERELVGALGDALTRTGQPINLRAMDAGTRSHAEALLNQLTKLNNLSRQKELQGEPAGISSVYRMQYVTNAEVSAKGL
jgi:hypothetical protein